MNGRLLLLTLLLGVHALTSTHVAWAQPVTASEPERTESPAAHAASKPKKPRRKPQIPVRAGASLVLGGTLPNAAPVIGFALRAGLQRKRCAFLLEGGLAGAFGGALTSGDQHASRATLFYHGYIAPTVALQLAPLHVSLGVPLGVGMWSSTNTRLDGLGTVRTEARSTTGLLTFVAGLDARVGRHFALHGKHHFTVAAGTRVLFAREAEATTTIPQRGAIEGSSDRTVGVRFVPTLTVGYDFF